jgi:hypothetical protein
MRGTGNVLAYERTFHKYIFSLVETKKRACPPFSSPFTIHVRCSLGRDRRYRSRGRRDKIKEGFECLIWRQAIIHKLDREFCSKGQHIVRRHSEGYNIHALSRCHKGLLGYSGDAGRELITAPCNGLHRHGPVQVSARGCVHQSQDGQAFP